MSLNYHTLADFRVNHAATLDRLLTPQPESPEFETAEPLLRGVALDTGNIADLKAWWLYRLLASADPLVEKLTLGWHNHFATSHAKVRSVPQMLAQNELFRREALGNFRPLLQAVSQDVAMLIWLDGNANRKRHANENYARELLELFSLGVGHYTERDIAEAARAFSGWHVRDGKFWFDRSQHDEGQKTVLGRTGNLNGGEVVELCLDQAACPQFLAGKLLRWFVASQPAPEAVNALADRIRLHDFQWQPVLRELLGSQLFFSPRVRGTLIKSPVELVLGTFRTLGHRPQFPPVVQALRDLGQDLFEPPTVKGWDGGRMWINSSMLLQRSNFAAEIATGNRFGSLADPAPSATTLAATTLNETEAAALVDHYVELLLARDIDAESIARLRESLTLSTGTRSERLRGLIHVILTMPEYQLL